MNLSCAGACMQSNGLKVLKVLSTLKPEQRNGTAIASLLDSEDINPVTVRRRLGDLYRDGLVGKVRRGAIVEYSLSEEGEELLALKAKFDAVLERAKERRQRVEA